MCTDLLDSNCEKVKTLETDCFIGSCECSAALVKLNKIFLGTNTGFGNECTLVNNNKLLVIISGCACNCSVIKAVDYSCGCNDL